MDPKEYAEKKFKTLEATQPQYFPHTGQTGPKTTEGKNRSRLNATKHSLFSKIHIASPAELEVFDRHCQAYYEALAPVGMLEEELARGIAEDRWRLKRARAIENSIFAQGHHDHADRMESGHPEVDAALAEGKTWIEQARNIQLLTLYESRIRRAVERNTAELKAMQAERKTAYAEARGQAIQLAQVAESEGMAYDPASDFLPHSDHGHFVFSPSEIARYLDRNRRLDQARLLPPGAERAKDHGKPTPKAA